MVIFSRRFYVSIIHMGGKHKRRKYTCYYIPQAERPSAQVLLSLRSSHLLFSEQVVVDQSRLKTQRKNLKSSLQKEKYTTVCTTVCCIIFSHSNYKDKFTYCLININHKGVEVLLHSEFPYQTRKTVQIMPFSLLKF